MENPTIAVIFLNMKKCRKCNVEKQLTNFRKRANGTLYHQCNSCQLEKQRIHRRKKSVINQQKRKQKLIDTGIELGKLYVGKEFGSYKITKYMGRLIPKGDSYERYYFEKTCKFCGVSHVVNKTTVDSQEKNQSKCHLCKESINIHTKERKCSICDTWKPATNEHFHLHPGRPFGVHYYCIGCKNKKTRERRSIRENSQKEYEQKKLRYQTDDLFKMTCRIKSNIKNAILYKGRGEWKKTTQTAKILQCDYKTFKHHIESQFTEGMSWENYGKWHFEHRIPSSYGETIEEVMELCHYTNYRPMWGMENISKGNKLHINDISEENMIRYKKFIDRYVNSDLVRY